MPKVMLIEAGVDPKKDFAEFKFLGSHTNVANAVAMKTFDGGAAMDSVAERFEKEGKVKIIARSKEMPDAPICVNKNLKPELAQRISEALMKLKADNPEGKAVLVAINEKYNRLRTGRSEGLRHHPRDGTETRRRRSGSRRSRPSTCGIIFFVIEERRS